VEANAVIRRIGASEAAVVRAVRLRSLATDPPSFASTHAREAAFAEQEWSDWAAGDSSGEEKTTLLALAGSEPVGLVAAYRDEQQPRLFHVIAMWVAPEARREGIGRRLLDAVEEWIAASGGTCAQVSVADEAVAANRLYDTAGYRPDGERSELPHSPGVSHASLRKQLGS
jgi:ribosomal protein S18 acetylase RimI-like enzyme